MLSVIGDVVRNVTVIIFLTTILDLLLPGNKLQPFIKMVMGLFVVVTIISPLVNLFDDQSMLSGWDMKLPDYQGVDSIMAQGEQYNAQVKSQTLVEYEGKLGQQMKGLVSLAPDVENCEVKVDLAVSDQLGTIGTIEQVEVWVGLYHNDGDTLPAVAQGERKPVNQQQAVEQVKKMLTNYYGLTDQQVVVNLMEGERTGEKKDV